MGPVLQGGLLALVLAAVALAGCATGPGPPVAAAAPAEHGAAPPSATAPVTGQPRPAAAPPGPIGNGTGPAGPSPNGTGPAATPATTAAEGNATPPGPKPVWGDATAPIYPGIQVFPSGCTSNFLFTSQDNRRIFLGTAAHCLKEEDPAADPATAPEDSGYACDPRKPLKPLGTPVQFVIEDNQAVSEGWTYVAVNGTLAYHSWQTMRDVGEAPDSLACAFNDFALIEIPLEAQGLVTPGFRGFGPVNRVVAAEDLELLTPVNVYGHSNNWFSQEALHQAWGYVTVPPPAEWDEWDFSFLLNRPSIWGDSGSAVMTSDGGAAGILTTIATMPSPAAQFPGTIPAPGTNGGTVLSTALDYLEANTGLRVKIAEP